MRMYRNHTKNNSESICVGSGNCRSRYKNATHVSIQHCSQECHLTRHVTRYITNDNLIHSMVQLFIDVYTDANHFLAFARGTTYGVQCSLPVSIPMFFWAAAVRMCSSMILGVTEMMWSPFQYLMRPSDSRVLTMSSVRIAVSSAISLIERWCLCSLNRSSSTLVQ